ncbi:MAG: NHLP bacteriocin export ABC transporter permease/ATPase subunit [Deltaproteobacteria bacterium]|nr:NHLP bacteriocin export ABC transporter permease/ATPase subunit [Deltaproteobacteria bacterium]
METMSDIFETEGSIRKVSGNKPLLLDDEERIFVVHSGNVDVFSVQMDKGELKGPRVHVFRAHEGEALFGMRADRKEYDAVLLAVGGPDTSLMEYARSALIEDVEGSTYRKKMGDMIDRWVGRLSAGIRKEIRFPRDFSDLNVASDIFTQEETYFRTPEKTLWIKPSEGTLQWMGKGEWPEILKGEYFPLSTNAWIVTEGKTTFSVIDGETLFGKHREWKALCNFHRYALRCLALNQKLTERDERERIHTKDEARRSQLAQAFYRLGSILEEEKKVVAPQKDKEDPLFAACRMIGDSLGMAVRSPAIAEKDSGNGFSLEDIARSSGFRSRQVILKETWWRRDQGPLLAFADKEKRPVALISVSPRKYAIYDPAMGTRQMATSRTVESLAPEAYSFYRPFPNRALTGLDLIKFGFRGCGGALTSVILMGVLGALLGLLIPIMTGIIFDRVIPEASRGQLMQISLVLATAAVAMLMFDVTKSIALLRIVGKTDSSIQAAIWDRLLSLPVPFFRDYSAGDLAKRAMGVNEIRDLLSGVTVNAILACLFSIFSLALLFYYDVRLALVGVGLSMIGILITGIASYLVVRYQRKINEIEGKISGMVLQFISGITKLRVSGTEDRAFAAWAGNFAEKKELAFKAGTIQNMLTSFNSAFPVIASMSIFAWLIWKTTGGRLSTGNFLAFNAAYCNFQMAMLQMAAALATSLSIIPLYERLKPIIEATPETNQGETHPGALSGAIEVSHINFHYSHDGPIILKDVSLQVAPGQFIALVGGSGSGKSTLLRLLLGFEKQESGAIYYDGHDLASLDFREVRQQVGVVLQNAQLMQGDIFRNIIGASNLTIDDAWEAARMVGIDKDIEEMPMGMHTVVSAGGGTLSGGQRQRLIIARAIVKKPRILFFDEATSALDNHTQAIVSHSLEKLEVTRVVIAHRLSTIMNADLIYVLQDGKIIESGAYHELMRQKGFFAELAARQLA